MDRTSISTFVRHLPLATSRRGLASIGGVLGGSVLARLGFFPEEVFAAKSGRCKTPCGVCERCDRGKCRKQNGKKRCQRGRCKPKPDGAPCCPPDCFGGCQDGVCEPCLC